MCELLNVFIQPTATGEARQEVAKLIKAQAETLKQEQDGISLMTLGYNAKPNVKRSIAKSQYTRFINEGIREVKKLDTQAVILHSRTKTTGLVHKDNTHLFNREGWYMAHNGWVSKLSSYGAYSTGQYSGQKWLWDSEYHDYMPSGYQYKRGEGDDYKPVTGFASELPAGWVSKNKYKRVSRGYLTLSSLFEDCAECQKVTPDVCLNHIRAYAQFIEYENTMIAYGKQDNINAPSLIEPINKPFNVISDVIHEADEKPSKTDSELFLEALNLASLSREYLKKKMTELSFSGVATLINPASGVAYFLASREIDLVTDLKNYIALASYAPAVPKRQEIKKSAFGLTFDVPNNRTFTLAEGVYKLDLTNLQFNF